MKIVAKELFIATLILGVTHGMMSWIYIYMLPQNIFFTCIFCHRCAGLIFALLVNKVIINIYVRRIINPMISIIIGYQLFRFESYFKDMYLIPIVDKFHIMDAILTFIMFSIFWASINISKKILMDW